MYSTFQNKISQSEMNIEEIQDLCKAVQRLAALERRALEKRLRSFSRETRQELLEILPGAPNLIHSFEELQKAIDDGFFFITQDGEAFNDGVSWDSHFRRASISISDESFVGVHNQGSGCIIVTWENFITSYGFLGMNGVFMRRPGHEHRLKVYKVRKIFPCWEKEEVKKPMPFTPIDWEAAGFTVLE